MLIEESGPLLSSHIWFDASPLEVDFESAVACSEAENDGLLVASRLVEGSLLAVGRGPTFQRLEGGGGGGGGGGGLTQHGHHHADSRGGLSHFRAVGTTSVAF